MAMINYYFGSKEGVFVERIAYFKRQLNEIKETKAKVIEKLLLVVDDMLSDYMQSHISQDDVARTFTPQRPEMFTTIKSAMMENMLVLESIITEGSEDGTF
jgi:hypothetical protein